MNRSSELKDRIMARQKEMEAKLYEMKADTKGAFKDNIDSMQRELDNLKLMLKDGWDNMSDAVTEKLNNWLDKNK